MIAPTNGYSTPPVREQERPLGELFQELASDARNLISLELELAKTEMTDKATATGKDVGVMAAGGAIAYVGFMAVVAAVIVALANLIPLWLSALLVGIIVIVVGYALIQKGLKDLKRRPMAPEQTVASLKANKEWLQERG